MKLISFCLTGLQMSMMCFFFLHPSQLRCAEIYRNEAIKNGNLVLSENIEIFFSPGHVRILKEGSTKVLIDSVDSTSKVFDRLKNKITLKRSNYTSPIKVKIQYKGYPDLEFEIKPNDLNFKQIYIYYKSESTINLRSLSGFVIDSTKKKIKGQQVYLNANKDITDFLMRDYEFTNIAVPTDSTYQFYTKEKTHTDKQGNDKIAPDPGYLITLFKPKAYVRLDVVMDDGSRDSETNGTVLKNKK